ncbi:putative Sterigmatocystin biosynthesis monooxygenase stcW [Seiridium cardinale]
MEFTLPSQRVPIDQRPVDYSRPIKVICIGAGISGILTGIRFPQHIKNLDLVIYEKNKGLGGTCYPAIAYIPSPAYQFTFENNPHWSRFYSPGSEILSYLNHVADKYDARKYMKFEHEFKGARWSENTGKWEVTILRLSDNQIIYDTADVLLKATGTLNKWQWPDIPGLQTFKGTLLHSARWDPSFDATGKHIAVIGNGSTGIQIIPVLQPQAKHIDAYSHSKNLKKSHFSQNPESLLAYRKGIEEVLHKNYLRLFTNSPARQEGAMLLQELVQQKLASKPGLFGKLKPEWPVGCKRLGASPGYLEALVKTMWMDVFTSGIRRASPEAIVDNGGTIRAVDAIICATGFDTLFSQVGATPIYGQEGISLDEVWTPEPEAYLSIMPCKMPNFFLYLGPNGAPLSTMIVMIEFQCDYMIKCIQKLQREYLKTMVPKASAKDDFVKYADKFFAKTVLTEDCASELHRNRLEYTVPLFRLGVSSLPYSLEHGAGLGGLIAALFLIGTGAGGIKSNVSVLIFEQYTETKAKILTLPKTGERVIVDPQTTISNIYMIFYNVLCIGCLSGIPATYIELRVGFWAAYLVPFCVFWIAIAALVLERKKHVRNTPQPVLGKALKALGIAIRSGLQDGGNQTILSGPARQLYIPHHLERQVRRGAEARMPLPIAWLCYLQAANNLVSQAGSIETHGLPNDILYNFGAAGRDRADPRHAHRHLPAAAQVAGQDGAAADPGLTVMYATLAAVYFVVTCLFYYFCHSYDQLEDELFDLDARA